jgi:hypothetical protein
MEAGISITGQIVGLPEFGLNAKLSFTGLVAKLQWSIGPGGGYAMKKISGEEITFKESISKDELDEGAESDPDLYSKILIQAFDWNEWKFPDDIEPDKELGDDEFASVIEEMLSGKTNRTAPIEFLREKDEMERHFYTSNYEEIPLSAISNRIVEKARGKPIRRLKKSLETIAQAIRFEFAQTEKKGFFRDNFVSSQELDHFIDGGELESILDKNQDPLKVIL